MSGIELQDGTLIVSRAPNRLDELAITFSEILDRVGIDHVYIQGMSPFLLAALGRPKTSTSSSNTSTSRGTILTTRTDSLQLTP